MEYLKEFQAFAGRFSAAAEEKLTKVDGGTYNEFIRFYSKPSQNKAEDDEEQRQIDILLEELQLATEAPALLSAPEGTVLHTCAVETGVGPALAHLCVALEKCLFFGAGGAAPDFWEILWQAGRHDFPAAAGFFFLEESSTARCAIPGTDNYDGVIAQGAASVDNLVLCGNASSLPGTGDNFSAVVSSLMRVQTGHGRCRAWARGLLGLEGMSTAETELRKAAAAAAMLRYTAGVAATSTTNVIDNSGGVVVKKAAVSDDVDLVAATADTSSRHDASESTSNDPSTASDDPDAGGGSSSGSGDRSSVKPAPTHDTTIHVDKGDYDQSSLMPRDRPHRLLPPHLLPLWLRPGSQGASILDYICACLGSFQGRLIERGLSVRSSLDHAWLDQENIAAITTYTWPRFPRELLRCFVRGAGLLSVDGEYAPVADPTIESEGGIAGNGSLVLIGPNGCQIRRLLCRTDDYGISVADDESCPAAGAATDNNGESLGVPVGDRGDLDATKPILEVPPDKTVEPTMVKPVETSMAPFVPCWCLIVPVSPQNRAEKRIAYYCQGEGVLPPFRGWRATDAPDMPAPLLVFGKHSEGGALSAEGVNSESRTDAGEEEEVAGRPFRAAEAAIGLNLSETDPTVDAAGTRTAGDAASIEVFQTTIAQPVMNPTLSARRGSAAYVAADGNCAGAGDLGTEETSAAHSSVHQIAPFRRRKRRRPPERHDSARISSCNNSDVDGGANAMLRIVSPKLPHALDNHVGNETSLTRAGGSVGQDTEGHDFARSRIRAEGGVTNMNGLGEEESEENQDLTSFEAERWRLPEPFGELLVRTERIRQLIVEKAEKQALAFASRKNELLERLAGAHEDYKAVLGEPIAVTVERVLAERSGLREQAEIDKAAAREERVATKPGLGNVAEERTVPTLEELVAEKADELRTRTLAQRERKDSDDALGDSGGNNVHVDDLDRSNSARLVGKSLRDNAELGWPWPMIWLSAPRAPAAGLNSASSSVEYGVPEYSRVVSGVGDGVALTEEEDDGMETPPFSMEVASVEVADADDPGAAHVEYVLRITYREVRIAQDNTAHLVRPTEVDLPEGGVGDNCAGVRPAVPSDDPGASELVTLAASSRGLVQRTRVLSKRLNSLCALHQRLMWELEEERRSHSLPPELASRVVVRQGVEQERDGSTTKTPAFPDPFELGTLEEDVLRVHRDKLTPRFKANSPSRKLSARIGSYLSDLLYFLGVMESTGHASLRAPLSRTLNEALSTCDRDGRKKRTGDLILAVRTEDDPGGKLGSWVDDEARLRVQNRRCLGCGHAIAAEFLGMKKDYSPCRFADGLFCRRHCHNEGRRVIPHRVVHHWDFALHRVCQAAAAFLDATRFLPVVNLPSECPRLFSDHQVLRLVRARRSQLHVIRRVIMFQANGKCPAGARMLEKLLHGRMHLAVDPGLYSVEDMVGVKKGTLVQFLEEVLDLLLAHVSEECDACEAASGRVCSACLSGDKLYPFQASAVACCQSCGSLFHIECVAGGKGKGAGHVIGCGGSKWWAHILEGGKTFVCPQCGADAPLPAALGE